MSALINALTEAGTRADLLAQVERLIAEREETALRHDARVTELLAANNTQVDRRRVAEAALDAASFQARVAPWLIACHGVEIADDLTERGDRFAEEALELLQAVGFTRERLHALTAYVWGRPPGMPAQEVGGVMVTLAAFCRAHGINMHAAGEKELVRIWTKIEQIRAKQKAKPTGASLLTAGAPNLATTKQVQENIARELWHRFAPEHHIEWDNEAHKAEYILAAGDVLALAIPLAAVISGEARPIETAPKDGAWIKLLIDYAGEDGAAPLEDSAEPGWTLGFNNFENTDEDEWVFVGWDWCHDCIIETRAGKPIGWAPFLSVLAAPPVVAIEGKQHPDDIAVEGFAKLMSVKLACKRALGYRGWDDKEACSNEHLSQLLRSHVEKGDPVDVANFAMMIHQRGERISPAITSLLDVFARGAEVMRERCAREADNFDQSPGDETPMGPVMVAQVEMAQRIATAIRAIPLPAAPSPGRTQREA